MAKNYNYRLDILLITPLPAMLANMQVVYYTRAQQYNLHIRSRTFWTVTKDKDTPLFIELKRGDYLSLRMVSRVAHYTQSIIESKSIGEHAYFAVRWLRIIVI